MKTTYTSHTPTDAQLALWRRGGGRDLPPVARVITSGDLVRRHPRHVGEDLISYTQRLAALVR